MSFTAKQVEKLIDNPPKGKVNINGLIELDHNDIHDLYMDLKDRDQRIINENIITITSDELKFVKPTDKEMRERANKAFRPKKNK